MLKRGRERREMIRQEIATWESRREFAEGMIRKAQIELARMALDNVIEFPVPQTD